MTNSCRQLRKFIRAMGTERTGKKHAGRRCQLLWTPKLVTSNSEDSLHNSQESIEGYAGQFASEANARSVTKTIANSGIRTASTAEQIDAVVEAR